MIKVGKIYYFHTHPETSGIVLTYHNRGKFIYFTMYMHDSKRIEDWSINVIDKSNFLTWKELI